MQARAWRPLLLQKLAQLKGELTTTAERLLEEQAHAADLQAVIDSYDARVLAPLAKRLTASEDAHAEQLQQHQQAQEVQQRAVQQLSGGSSTVHSSSTREKMASLIAVGLILMG